MTAITYTALRGLNQGTTELITNGTFDTDVTSWTAGDAASTLAWDAGGQRAQLTNGDATAAWFYQAITTVSGSPYYVISTGTNSTSGTAISIGTSAGASDLLTLTNLTDSTAQTVVFEAQSTTSYINYHLQSTTSGHTAYFDDLSAKYGHASGFSYNLETNAIEISDQYDAINEPSISLDGSSESLLHRVDNIYTMTSGIITTTDLPWWREFIQSVSNRESFTFDPFGTIASPDDPFSVTMIGNPQQITLSKSRIYAYGFTFRVE